jgi:hypothetical protein
MYFAKIPKVPQTIQTTPNAKQIHCPIKAAREGVTSFGPSPAALLAFCPASSACL